MHIELFRALTGVNVTDDQAERVVKSVEEHIAVRIEDANKGLEGRLAGVEAKLAAQTWVIGAVGVVLAVIGLAPAFMKIF